MGVTLFAVTDQRYGQGRFAAPGPITITHLLTHTAGFEDVVEDLFVLSPDRMHALGEWLKTFLAGFVQVQFDLNHLRKYNPVRYHF